RRHAVRILREIRKLGTEPQVAAALARDIREYRLKQHLRAEAELRRARVHHAHHVFNACSGRRVATASRAHLYRFGVEHRRASAPASEGAHLRGGRASLLDLVLNPELTE